MSTQMLHFQNLLPLNQKAWSDLIVDNDLVGADVLHLWTKCLEHYFSGRYKECVMVCQWLLDMTWEKLNTGYWKDVPIVFQELYSYVSAIKVVASVQNPDVDMKDIIHTCDMGLLMGAPILNNILAKMASTAAHEMELLANTSITSTAANTCKRFKKDHWPVLFDGCLVAHVECPSVEHFDEKYVKQKKVVIILNAVNYWPAFSSRQWSLEYIRKVAGCRTVPIEIGSKYTDETWSQQLLTINDFIDRFVICKEEGNKVGYLAQHELFDQIPELRNDISVPTYCCIGDSDDVDINAWFGPQGTISPLHFDPKHNLLVQVIGEKYIRLYDEEYTESLYPHEGELLRNTSQVDVENPDSENFPLFFKAPYKECILKCGEMLYIPPRCWHYVRSLSVSFSVSFWWE